MGLLSYQAIMTTSPWGLVSVTWYSNSKGDAVTPGLFSARDSLSWLPPKPKQISLSAPSDSALSLTWLCRQSLVGASNNP